MLNSGLVSVTFRALKPLEIVKAVELAGLDGIEWGGDIHVPHGDVQAAKEVLKMTLESGISVASYGSYYKAGCEDKEYDMFKRVLDAAEALKAPVIRVWAGEKGSADASAEYRSKVVDSSKHIAALAMQAGIGISYEFHGWTLTDTNESAISFFNEIGHENVKSYWQPASSMDEGQRLDGLKRLGSLVSNIHVYYWGIAEDGSHIRKPLEEGEEEWGKYFGHIKTLPGNRYALLEFVKNDDLEQFRKDAQALKRFIAE